MALVFADSYRLGGRFGYFLFFFVLGEGKGGVRGAGMGGSVFIENPRRGGSPAQEGPRGREGVRGKLGNLGGVGAKYFFSGPKCPPSRFSLFLNYSMSEVQISQKSGGNRRKPQETADVCRNPFVPFSLPLYNQTMMQLKIVN